MPEEKKQPQNIYLKKSKGSVWGKPDLLTRSCIKQFQPGTVLDIGIGDGRYAIEIAQRGFKVYGVDRSKEAIVRLKKRIKNRRYRIMPITLDVRDYQFKSDFFNNVISLFTLQFLSKRDAFSVIKKMKATTKVGGINLIFVFSNSGALYKMNKDKKNRYFFSIAELKRLYSDWEIIMAKKIIVNTAARSRFGRPYKQPSVFLCARKK